MSIIHHSVLYTDWGNEYIKDTFMFCEDIMDRDLPVQLRDKDQIYILAGDRECLGICNLSNFINEYETFSVKSNRTFDSLCFDSLSDIRSSKKDKAKTFERLLKRSSQIELDKMDVVMGCDSKMTKTLNSLKADGCDNAVIGVSCLNKLIGTDISAIMQQCHSCQITEDINYVPQDFLDAFIERHKHRLSKGQTNVKKNTFNLMGYPLTDSLVDFTRLFDFWGLKVNEAILPRIRLDVLDNFFAAELNVANDKEYYYPLYEVMDMPMLKLPPPLGMANSLEWIKNIITKFGLDIENQQWIDYYIPKKEEWDELRLQAESKKALLLFSINELKFIKDDKEFFSYRMNMIELLEEMGFTVHIMVYNTSRGDYEQIKESLGGTSQDRKLIFERITSMTEIDDRVIASNTDLVYSDIYFDERAASLGKATFSYADFEYGFTGAINTLKRLLNLCQIDYYKRYKKYHKYQINEV